MGGRSPAQIVSTAVAAVSTPFVGAVVATKEIVGSNSAAKVDALPIVGTVTTGIEAQGNIAGTTTDAAISGDFSQVRKEGADLAKYGAVVGAAYGGAAYLGAEAVVPAAQFGELAGKRGIDVGTLSGAAAAYFGNDLASYGIDVQTFFPKEKPVGSFDLGSGSVGKYFQTPKEYSDPSSSGATTTLILGAIAVIVFVMIIRGRK